MPLVESCCPAQSVCHITVSRLMSERILNVYIYKSRRSFVKNS